jgi:hypothetical protein
MKNLQSFSNKAGQKTDLSSAEVRTNFNILKLLHYFNNLFAICCFRNGKCVIFFILSVMTEPAEYLHCVERKRYSELLNISDARSP